MLLQFSNPKYLLLNLLPEGVVAMAVAAAAEGRRHRHVEQHVVEEGTLDATTRSTRGTAAAHLGGKLEKERYIW